MRYIESQCIGSVPACGSKPCNGAVRSDRCPFEVRPMPELPEVETTRLGLLPRLQGRTLKRIVVRNPRLRWPVPDDLEARLAGLKLVG
jgi:hypothetical protein